MGDRMFYKRLATVLSGILMVACFPLLSSIAHAQAVANQFDACAVFPKQSALINISSATDTQLVAAQTNSNVWLCGMFLNQVDGVGSLGFEYGTGTNCATGKTTLSGNIYASTVASGVTNTSMQPGFYTGTQLVAPAGNALCANTTGSIQQSGWITYVQQPATPAASFFDPCNVYQRQSAPIKSSTAATTSILTAPSSIYPTYICNVFAEDAGNVTTANTTTFKYGTGATCGTGTTNLTGPITGTLTAGTPSFIGPQDSAGTDWVLPAGQNLCDTTTQAITEDGWITYVTGR
jgi:hypothetical protein